MPAFRKPGALERAFGRGLLWLVRLGVVRGHFYVLEVRGRKTGRTLSLPVDPIAVAGARYLVCARGESQWVRNARAAGEVALLQAGRRQYFSVREVPPPDRPPILKAYLDTYAAEVQRFFPLPKGAAAPAFAAFASRYPVFELIPLSEGNSR